MGKATHPLLGRAYVTDGGIETDLIFHHGLDLPLFAAFPLLDTEEGRSALRAYYSGYVPIAAAAGVPLLLETPTWRASRDWGMRLGYDQAALDRVNRDAVVFLAALGAQAGEDLVGWEVGGIIGPRDDGYRAGAVDPDDCAELHRPQLAAFASAGASRATALTMTTVAEALGVARAAADVGIPLGLGFTVETDGRLPDGTTLGDAIAAVDADTPPDYFVVNCAHPAHIVAGLDGGAWQSRVGGLRPNASMLSHAELDESETLDDGDPVQLAVGIGELRAAFPNAAVVGGCCGTDARHVAAAWGVPVSPS